MYVHACSFAAHVRAHMAVHTLPGMDTSNCVAECPQELLQQRSVIMELQIGPVDVMPLAESGVDGQVPSETTNVIVFLIVFVIVLDACST